MGRKPLGESAMSGAERIRRWRERHGMTTGAKTDSRDDKELRAEIARLRERVRVLEAQLGHDRAKASQSKNASPQTRPLSADERRRLGDKMRADFRAMDAENAQWGGRGKSLVVDDIRRLLANKVPDDVKDTIVQAMLPHVAKQAHIERGISRKTYRKVLADLHPDRPATGHAAAFNAFKKLDVSKTGKWNARIIVIADDKVRTMADLERKRQERSDKARAAAAKRKQVGG